MTIPRFFFSLDQQGFLTSDAFPCFPFCLWLACRCCCCCCSGVVVVPVGLVVGLLALRLACCFVLAVVVAALAPSHVALVALPLLLLYGPIGAESNSASSELDHCSGITRVGPCVQHHQRGIMGTLALRRNHPSSSGKSCFCFGHMNGHWAKLSSLPAQQQRYKPSTIDFDYDHHLDNHVSLDLDHQPQTSTPMGILLDRHLFKTFITVFSCLHPWQFIYGESLVCRYADHDLNGHLFEISISRFSCPGS